MTNSPIIPAEMKAVSSKVTAVPQTDTATSHGFRDMYDDSDDDSTQDLLPNGPTSQRQVLSRISRNRGEGRTKRTGRDDWLRPYWLGFSLMLLLFAFWLLDSLKDPIFAVLVDGDLDQHQPPAKLLSVATTVALVLILEALSFSKAKTESKEQGNQQQRSDQEILDEGFSQTPSNPIRGTQQRTREDVLDGGGAWTRMFHSEQKETLRESNQNDRVPLSLFTYIGMSYVIVFLGVAYILKSNPNIHTIFVAETTTVTPSSKGWHALGYFLYASIESFGSLSVATFWSYTNSTLSLHDAERYYGLIIAMAQIGAFAGSTMATTHRWSSVTLIVVACLVIVLQLLVIRSFGRRYPPCDQENDDNSGTAKSSVPNKDSTSFCSNITSGVHLIWKHNYVLMILGVSCLYEVSLTCLDYQMKLLGWDRFEVFTAPPTLDGTSEQEQSPSTKDMTFAQFMGHWGQLTNLISLLLSSACFPYLIRKFGLRYTLRLFPTLLLFVTLISYEVIPGNLEVLFVSMSFLKAMTYSIHDPAKEILYLPTSNAIKFRAKFWIDVVGARVAKAVGSSINKYAGSVVRVIKFGALSSVATATALWVICHRIGIHFDHLVKAGLTVGIDHPSRQVKDLWYDAESDDELQIRYRDEESEDVDLLGGIPERITRDRVEVELTTVQ